MYECMSVRVCACALLTLVIVLPNCKKGSLHLSSESARLNPLTCASCFVKKKCTVLISLQSSDAVVKHMRKSLSTHVPCLFSGEQAF